MDCSVPWAGKNRHRGTGRQFCSARMSASKLSRRFSHRLALIGSAETISLPPATLPPCHAHCLCSKADGSVQYCLLIRSRALPHHTVARKSPCKVHLHAMGARYQGTKASPSHRQTWAEREDLKNARDGDCLLFSGMRRFSLARSPRTVDQGWQRDGDVGT